jgi:hypothetical protein
LDQQAVVTDHLRNLRHFVIKNGCHQAACRTIMPLPCPISNPVTHNRNHPCPQTNTERQRAWRERHRGEPRGNKAMQVQLAALQGHVAQLEVKLAATPSAEPRAPSGRLREAYLAVRKERNELAMTLAQIEAYQPGIAVKARTWVEQVDGAPRRQ